MEVRVLPGGQEGGWRFGDGEKGNGKLTGGMETLRPSPLLMLLRQKIALQEKGDPAHQRIRPVLVVLGGAMRGVGGGAIACALHDLGVARAFEALVGLSAGAPTVAYFAAGNPATYRGTAIFYNTLPPDFVRFTRYPFLLLPKLERAFRWGDYRLPDPDKWELSVPVWVGMYEKTRERLEWVDVRTAKDPVAELVSACAVPVLWPGGVPRDGRVYFDGELLFGKALPHLLARIGATDVVVIANTVARSAAAPFSRLSSLTRFLERGAFRLIQFGLPMPKQEKEILSLFLKFQQSFTFEVVERVSRLVPRVYVLWNPPPIVGRLTQNPRKLFRYAERSYRSTFLALGVAPPKNIPLVPLAR